MPWAAVVIVIKIIVVVMVIVILLRAAAAVPDVQGDVTRRGSKQFQLTLTQETLFSTVAEGTELFSEMDERRHFRKDFSDFQLFNQKHNISKHS